MSDAFLWPLQHPLWSIGAVISFVACIGFLIFLRGFLLGLSHLFYLDGHDEHVGHARDRVGWGVVLMVNMFVLWISVRGIATLLGYDHADLSQTGTILISYCIIVLYFYIMGFAFAKSSNGH